MHGSMKEHYCKLGSYVEALKQANPNSVFEIVYHLTSEEHIKRSILVFQRMFICFEGLRNGFLGDVGRFFVLMDVSSRHF